MSWRLIYCPIHLLQGIQKISFLKYLFIKGSDRDDVISISDVPATPIIDNPDDNDDNTIEPVQLEVLPTDDDILPAAQLDDLPFEPKEDTLRDLLDQRAVDINKVN